MHNKESQNSDNQVATVKASSRVVDADGPATPDKTTIVEASTAEEDETTVSAPRTKLPNINANRSNTVDPRPGNKDAEATDSASTVDAGKQNGSSASAHQSTNGAVHRQSAKVVRADSVEAEEVPTIPMDSLHTLNQLQPEVIVRPVAATRNIKHPTPLVVLPSEYRRSAGEAFQNMWHSVRSRYLLLSLMPAILGSVLAWSQSFSLAAPFGRLKVLTFIGTLLAIILIQLGANLINDYYDYRKGVDAANTFGPGGFIQQGTISQPRVLYAGLGMLVVGALIGFILAISAGSALALLFVLIGMLCAYFYSGSKRPLAAITLGELVSFFLFGPLIVLSAYLIQQGSHLGLAFLYSLPYGLFAAAAIHVNNMRDLEGDAQAGKRTIATFMSLPLNRTLYCILIIAAYAMTVTLALPHGGPHLLLITLWTLPTAVLAVSGVLRTDNPANFHLVMRQTLRLIGFFTLWACLALLVLAAWPLLSHYPALLLHL